MPRGRTEEAAALISSAVLLRSFGAGAVTSNAGWVRIAWSCEPLAWPAIDRHCRLGNAQRARPSAAPRGCRTARAQTACQDCRTRRA
jgi:hypothetical protein